MSLGFRPMPRGPSHSPGRPTGRGGGCARVGGMFAPLTYLNQNWWWTADPAAH
ncbi:trp operon leader peptide [Streptomyces sp. PR69]|uniref:trp operon leader peptide n=1 Tax=Streptomyces sp. PR69 TaxID=2984950 RepID=UPI003A5BC7BD